jgi:hypothetical protein
MSRICAVLPVGIVAVMVKTIGDPAVRVPVVDGVIESVGTGFTRTVTVAEVEDPVVEPPPVPPVPPVPPEPLDPPALSPALAVTVASTDVVRVVLARPLASEMTDEDASAPAVVVKITGTDGNGLPLMSVTAACRFDVPPWAEMVLGLAPRTIRPTAAAPTAIRRLRSPLVVVVPPVPPVVVEVPPEVVAPPEEAATMATPLAPPARNVTVARPLASVLTSAGSIVPRVVVKVTRVPLCGGVPAASSTCAVIEAVPFTGKAVVADVKVMVDPVGAKNGAFSQADTTRAASAETTEGSQCNLRGIM